MIYESWPVPDLLSAVRRGSGTDSGPARSAVDRAISGVLGAHLLPFPRARVLVAVPILFYVELISLPAAVILLLWFEILTERDGTLGLVLPGMPAGSLGMESANLDSYTVLALERSGALRPFATYHGR